MTRSLNPDKYFEDCYDILDKIASNLVPYILIKIFYETVLI